MTSVECGLDLHEEWQSTSSQESSKLAEEVAQFSVNLSTRVEAQLEETKESVASALSPLRQTFQGKVRQIEFANRLSHTFGGGGERKSHGMAQYRHDGLLKKKVHQVTKTNRAVHGMGYGDGGEGKASKGRWREPSGGDLAFSSSNGGGEDRSLQAMQGATTRSLQGTNSGAFSEDEPNQEQQQNYGNSPLEHARDEHARESHWERVRHERGRFSTLDKNSQLSLQPSSPEAQQQTELEEEGLTLAEMEVRAAMEVRDKNKILRTLRSETRSPLRQTFQGRVRQVEFANRLSHAMEGRGGAGH